MVDAVDFSVNAAEIVALLGPNGAGKTTTFYMTVGLIPHDSGMIMFDDVDISHYPMYRRGRLGLAYLPQEASVFRKLSVEQNILAILEQRSELGRADRMREMESLLDEFQIQHIRMLPGYVLSGGERRRTEIARSLAQNPRIILLDEPFAGVDPIAVEEIKGIIGRLKARGVSVLITDHNVRETLSICDRAYILSEGKILAHGNPAEIESSPQVRASYLGENYRGVQ